MFPKTCFAVSESSAVSYYCRRIRLVHIALEKCFLLPDEVVEGTCELINCEDYWKPLEYEVFV